MQDVAVGSGIQTDGYVLKWDSSSSLFVPGETSSSGINTTGTSYFNNIEASGDVNITGDLVYDEATARNWNVTGVATAAAFNIGVGGTDILTAINERTTIGLALALS